MKFKLIVSFAFLVLAQASMMAQYSKQNVLFIIIDDLRPQINSYGYPQMVTPNIDKLASEGLLFTRAYSQVPTCGGSRASMMTGLYPTPNRFTNYKSRADRDAPHVPTLPEYFKQNGYYTVSRGKVFHTPDDSKAKSWSEEPTNEANYDYYLERNKGYKTVAWEHADVSDTAYSDGKVAQTALQDIAGLKGKNEPFFLAVGFKRPHLPFNAPKKYWNLYNHDEIQLADHQTLAEHAPEVSGHNSFETRSYGNVPDKGPFSPSLQKNLIHGYYACVSYIDAQVGKLIDELKRQNLYENTTIVLTSDHGWNLGEHGLWNKHCMYNTSLQVPLIVRTPQSVKGSTTTAIAELIDLYPTLCEVNNLPSPKHLQGKSLAPVLQNPSTHVKAYSFSGFYVPMGERILTHDNYTFSRWVKNDNDSIKYMMFNHNNDLEEKYSLLKQNHPMLYKELHQVLINHVSDLQTTH